MSLLSEALLCKGGPAPSFLTCYTGAVILKEEFSLKLFRNMVMNTRSMASVETDYMDLEA